MLKKNTKRKRPVPIATKAPVKPGSNRRPDEPVGLTVTEHRIRALLDATVDAIITIDTAGNIDTFNKAAQTMFGYEAKEVIGQNVSILMGPPHRDRHDKYVRRYLKTRDPHVIGRVRSFLGRRKDGSDFPIQISVSEVDHMGLFTGIVRDVSEYRVLQEEIVRIATAEQRRIGQELHDSTQQELTGLGLLAKSLVDALGGPELSAQRGLAKRIAAGIAETNLHVHWLANGLVPVPVHAEGLMVALEDLTQRTERDTGISCRFVCPTPVQVPDDNVAMHLYRIVQEAILNAVKHARADVISARMEHSDGFLAVEIEDDGVGIDENRLRSEGLGLRIMEHRCELIGGTFIVRRRESGGTIVRCEVPTVSGQ